MRIALILGLSLALLFVPARVAVSHELEPEDAGHPLRLAAYILHPAGFLVYQLVLRPAHALVSLPGASALFGHEEEPSQEPLQVSPSNAVLQAPWTEPEAQAPICSYVEPHPELMPAEKPEQSVSPEAGLDALPSEEPEQPVSPEAGLDALPSEEPEQPVSPEMELEPLPHEGPDQTQQAYPPPDGPKYNFGPRSKQAQD